MDIDGVTAASLGAQADKDDAQRSEKLRGVADHSKVEAEIAAAKLVASKGSREEAVETLLAIEKGQRLAEDVTGTRLACKAVLEVLFEAKDWAGLNEHIILLSKRRSQLKQAVQAFVRQSMGYIEATPDKDTMVELIKTLQSVTEGKIYVEIERARLTRRLAKIKEAEGKIDEAADTLQEVAVETFGAMAKTEKIAFILEQVRLCLERKDFVRAQILIRKVSPRAFVPRPDKKGQNTGEVGIEGTTIEAPAEGTPSLEELKLLYYRLFIRYHEHDNNYLEICRCYRSIYETDTVVADPEQWQPVLKKISWFVVLAPSCSDQITLLNTTAADKRLAELPLYKDLLGSFLTKEVVWWSTLSDKFADEVALQSQVFGGEHGEQRHKDFRLRVTEHNILVVGKFYARIRMSRLAQLLDLPVPEAEKHLSDMVVAGALAAKIDRPAGIVRFAARQEPDLVLNTWASNISKLLQCVEKASQQIQKESMVHRVPIGNN